MKKIIVFTMLLIFTFLAGCQFRTTDYTTDSLTTNNSSTSNSSNPSTDDSTFTKTDSFTSTDITESITTITDTQMVTTEPVYDRYQDIYLYSVNDFHGGAYLDFDSFSSISNEIRYMKENYDHVLALTNGDIFQGTAISNYYYGRPLVEAMNAVDFDGFIIGNHEFDWGIEKIGEYKDNELINGEADFPILAANIVYKDTQKPLEFTEPYLVSDVNGVKVGVIGVIGNVMDSIAASRVQNIEFLDPVDVIEDYSKYLRTEKAVDIVVVYIHSGSEINFEIASLTGDSRVDVVFNGHTHKTEASTIEINGSNLIYAQASSNQYSLMAKIKLTFDRERKEITNFDATILSQSDIFETDNEVDSIFETYKTDTTYLEFVNEVLTYAEDDYGRYDLGKWGATTIRDYLGIDIGAVNYGGFRTTMYQGEVTMGDLVVIYPFDNVIKTSKMTGKQITDFYLSNPYDVAFDYGLTSDGYTVYLNDTPLEPGKYYTVGAVDYIFDKTDFDFIDGIDITYTGQYMRDLLVMDLIASNNSFNPANKTSYKEPMSYFYNEIFVSLR